MRYSVERSDLVAADLLRIILHLRASYIAFGEPPGEALHHAVARVRSLEERLEAIGMVPHQGTLRPALGPAVRSVTRSGAIFYFETDDDLRRVRVLAVFFGGQDHIRLMLHRHMGSGGSL